MAGEMFGAPAGIGAGEADWRQQLIGGLQAQEILGKIAMQPGQMRLTDAHARLYEAEAGAKEATAAAERRMAELALAAAPEQTAAATANTSLAPSPATPLQSLATLAFKSGLWRQGVDLTTKAVTVSQKEAAAAASRASEQLRLVRAQTAEAGRQASFALSAVDQPSYDRLRMTLAEQGQDVSALPESYEQAKPMLQQVVTAGMTAKDTLAQTQKRIQDEAERKKWSAQAGAATAAAEASKARAKLITQTYDTRAKNGGKDSPEVVALRKARKEALKERTAASRRAEQAKDLAKYPPAPADPSKRIVGNLYTWPDGSKILWTTNPATGKPGAQLVLPPKASGNAVDATDAEDDDDLDGED